MLDIRAEKRRLAKYLEILSSISPSAGKELRDLLEQSEVVNVFTHTRRVLEEILKELCHGLLYRQAVIAPLPANAPDKPDKPTKSPKPLDCDNVQVGRLLGALSEAQAMPSHISRSVDQINKLALPGPHVKAYHLTQARTILSELDTLLDWYVYDYHRRPRPKPVLPWAGIAVGGVVLLLIIVGSWWALRGERWESGVSQVRLTPECDQEEAHRLTRRACAYRNPQGELLCDKKQLQKALTQCPEHPEANSNLGELFLQDGDFETASTHFQLALWAACGDLQPAWYGLGQVYENAKHPNLADYAYYRACRSRALPEYTQRACRRVSSHPPSALPADIETWLDEGAEDCREI